MTAADVTFVDALPEGGTWRRVTVLREDDLGHYDEFRRFLAAALGLEGRSVPAEPALVRAGSGAFYELVVVGRAGAPFPSGVEVAAVLADFAALDDDAVDADLWALLRWLYAGVGEGWDVAALEATGRLYRLPFAAPAAPPP